jgi:hypothetical protein
VRKGSNWTKKTEKQWTGNGLKIHRNEKKIVGNIILKRAYIYIYVYIYGAGAFLRSRNVLSYSRNSPHFMEPEGSSPYTQEPATCPYSEPDRCSLCPTIQPLEDTF